MEKMYKKKMKPGKSTTAAAKKAGSAKAKMKPGKAGQANKQSMVKMAKKNGYKA